ncbi:Inhibitor-I78 domain containing protein [Pyrenophora tritici-repentis]|nr:Inhibitor-I78 domain-containing protein [Pyrenophora tritici-repentis]KAI0582378.1 Inhibitor-I78 domain-containing protein [Pyrenophora tritici-repentis]KAI0609380.1 Inhibitor-I78 domain-containing protein [Pyrenophora tritici-repentis]KAI0621682.1 hypothetical protein TUN199_06319 [Pyrenophora tritici-repentis]KAI2487741.1 Inhibitor-I78 domain containing protein [Pyrenophora tritici-repentis]
MPLVVPGLQSTDGKEDWMTKLMGKKLGDQHDEMRSQIGSYSKANTYAEKTFAKTDLPKEHRIVKPDSMSTMDHKPERLNVHVDEDGTVKKVTHG